MPERDLKPHSPFSLAYLQSLTLSAAAEGNWLVRARCPNCGQAVYMLPGDLQQLLERDQRIVSVPMDCQRCGVRARVQPMEWKPGDRLELRRPGPDGWETFIAEPGELR